MIEHREESIWVRLGEQELEIASIDDFLHSPSTGAVCVFVGTTRRHTARRETLRLEYEAYEAMAITEMERIGREAAEEWPIERLCIHHRIGLVPAMEGSVICGVATPHRAAAFEACRFLIDEVKVRVPIWKREHLRDGSREWVESDENRVGEPNRAAE